MADDFSPSTVARSPKEFVALMYLNRYNAALDAEQSFLLANKNTTAYERYKKAFSASLWSLWRMCSTRMGAKGKAGGVSDLIEGGDLSEAFGLLIDYLESDLKITDIAKVQDFDRTNIILSNRMKGFK